MTGTAKRGRGARPGKRPDRTRSQSSREIRSWKDDEERIAKRAYELYLERGPHPGAELDDWLRAEHEVRTRRSS